MKKILFIDRDGTILREPPDEQIDSIEKMEFLPGVLSNLGRIIKENDYELVLVSNQDGLGTDSFPEADFWPVQHLMLKILAGEGIRFTNIFIDPTFPGVKALTRKPGLGMVRQYLNGDYDLASSWVIGDRISDVEFAKNLGARSIQITENDLTTEADYQVKSWDDIPNILRYPKRKVSHRRTTLETDIMIDLDLDGDGHFQIESGIGFFDHMLAQLARHSGMDLTIQANGDLHVDEHHTVEDVAITLGEAIRAALGNKSEISRYGFFLPMDESSARVAIDFSGRACLRWDGSFKREKIGEMPTELSEIKKY